MNPLQRAEAVVRRARSINKASIYPGDAYSPMDVDPTLTVPRELIAACEPVPRVPEPNTPDRS